jgi:hypothetical protein
MNRTANTDWAYGSPDAHVYREPRDVLLEADTSLLPPYAARGGAASVVQDIHVPATETAAG